MRYKLGSLGLKPKQTRKFAKEMYEIFDTIKERMCEDKGGNDQIDILFLNLKVIKKYFKLIPRI